MKRKQGTFSSEIAAVLSYYRAVAQRSRTRRNGHSAVHGLCAGAPLRVVPIKAAASRTG
jgi:hypothetical protein